MAFSEKIPYLDLCGKYLILWAILTLRALSYFLRGFECEMNPSLWHPFDEAFLHGALVDMSGQIRKNLWREGHFESCSSVFFLVLFGGQ